MIQSPIERQNLGINKCVKLVVEEIRVELVAVKTRGNNKSCKLKQIQEIFVSQCQCCFCMRKS